MLHLAVDRGHSYLVRLLIEAGANTNRRTPHGETALYLAAANGCSETVFELLYGNADPRLTTGGFTPMEVAAGKGHSKTVLELIQLVGLGGCGGASRGADALNYATQKQHVDTMVVLSAPEWSTRAQQHSAPLSDRAARDASGSSCSSRQRNIPRRT